MNTWLLPSNVTHAINKPRKIRLPSPKIGLNAGICGVNGARYANILLANWTCFSPCDHHWKVIMHIKHLNSQPEKKMLPSNHSKTWCLEAKNSQIWGQVLE